MGKVDRKGEWERAKEEGKRGKRQNCRAFVRAQKTGEL